MTPVRCAIYTRKSSEDGLEQGFNSLHAQREACAAYVLSQASEGWTLLPDEYDDGGLSGGTLQRPALQRLLADVAAGKIDIIVVYKVDRLTRSLLDFAKLVEALDAASTSFVSITQSFNTTTSMGRLTLNMLLSFAQFEREVTAERIRDKLAASKAKGMWMGGVPPLGYRPDGRSLAIVDDHATLVRTIYARYRALGTVRELHEEFTAAGIITPVRTTGTGRTFGGGPFSRGQLYAILGNPIYVGEIPHRDKTYPGNHPPLIGRNEWDTVQHLLASNTRGERERPRRARGSALLGGLLVDGAGELLIATHSRKNGQRYDYYVSKALHLRTSDKGLRLPAREIERVVIDKLVELLAAPLDLVELAQLALPPTALGQVLVKARELVAALKASPPTLPGFVERVIVAEEGIELTLSGGLLAEALTLAVPPGMAEHLTLACPARLTHTGRAIRLVQENGARMTTRDGPDKTLLRLVTKARVWWQELSEGGLDPTALAAREGVTDSYVVKVVRLAFLSPRVIDGILAGQLKATVTGSKLLRPGAISPNWAEQEAALLAKRPPP